VVQKRENELKFKGETVTAERLNGSYGTPSVGYFSSSYLSYSSPP
jgi:hypothetical protein